MKIALSAHRPFHFVQLANALLPDASSVRMYSSAPRRFFQGLAPGVSLRFTPSPILLASHAFPRLVKGGLLDLDGLLYDLAVASVLEPSDLFFALATRALRSAQSAKRRGARFVLDRACPHVHTQQATLQREADRVGFRFRPQAQWFVDRQLAEYELADAILIPSRYTGNTFPPQFQSKLVLAPLLGRLQTGIAPHPGPRAGFTLGVIGNSPLRKGYLYLLRAWKRLALPNAQLLIRCSGGFDAYPELRSLTAELPNVRLLPYIADLSEFYRSLDAFVLPSVDDGFGMALFESLACGVPAIATTACGASELLNDGQDSAIVPPADEDALAETILKLYRSKDLRISLGIAGAATVARIQETRVYESAIHQLVSQLIP